MTLLLLLCLAAVCLAAVCLAAAADDDLVFDLPVPASIAAAAQARSAPAGFFFEAGANATAEDDAFGAAYFFTAATHAAPDRARTWHNLAFSLGRLAEGFRRAGPDTRTVVLCEALRAAQLADAMGNSQPSVQGDLLDALAEVREDAEDAEDDDEDDAGDAGDTEAEDSRNPADLCLRVPGGGAHRRVTAALAFEARGLHLRAVAALCTSPDALTLRPTAPELNRGMLTASTARLAWGFARVCGVLRLQNVIPQRVVSYVEGAVATDWEARRKPLLQASRRGDGVRYYESEDAAMRGDAKRFELKLPVQAPFTHQNLTAGMPMMTLVHMLLGGDGVELDTFSYVQSLPGANMQPWHRDVEALHRRSCDGDGGRSIGTADMIHIHDDRAAFPWTPAHGFVAVVPLVPVTPENGPTEFLAGSHVPAADAESFWEDMQSASATTNSDTCVSRQGTGHGGDNDGGTGDCAHSAAPSELSFAADQGDVVLFDLRLRHRGTPNRGNAARPILYVSYVREWFQDGTNFKVPQTRGWDRLAGKPHMKRLFSRVDALAYTRRLEALVKEALGAERGQEAIASLRSEAQYMQRGL